MTTITVERYSSLKKKKISGYQRGCPFYSVLLNSTVCRDCPIRSTVIYHVILARTRARSTREHAAEIDCIAVMQRRALFVSSYRKVAAQLAPSATSSSLSLVCARHRAAGFKRFANFYFRNRAFARASRKQTLARELLDNVRQRVCTYIRVYTYIEHRRGVQRYPTTATTRF